MTGAGNSSTAAEAPAIYRSRRCFSAVIHTSVTSPTNLPKKTLQVNWRRMFLIQPLSESHLAVTADGESTLATANERTICEIKCCNLDIHVCHTRLQ